VTARGSAAATASTAHRQGGGGRSFLLPRRISGAPARAQGPVRLPGWCNYDHRPYFAGPPTPLNMGHRTHDLHPPTPLIYVTLPWACDTTPPPPKGAIKNTTISATITVAVMHWCARCAIAGELQACRGVTFYRILPYIAMKDALALLCTHHDVYGLFIALRKHY
jgi:hypothetical protein